MDKTFIKWSHKEFNNLPWRKNRSLYGTLVSEIMLQQTTVGTVLKHFDRFLGVFPNLESLAKASEEEVCAQWQGLGYYRRARNLRKAAVSLVENYGGSFPSSVDELKKIPGIGDYTAGALLAIGMNKKAIAIDANLERVLARYFALAIEKGPKLQKALVQKFTDKELQDIFGLGKPRDVTEALMDVGRVYCQAKRADCLLCPLQSGCLAKKSKPLSFPHLKKESKPKEKNLELDLLRIVVKRGKKILGQTKSDSQWLTGQVEIPTFILRSQDRGLKQYPRISRQSEFLRGLDSLPLIKTAITKYKIRNYILTLKYNEFQELTSGLGDTPKYNFFNFNVQDIHFSTTTLKSFQKLGLEV